MSKPTARDFRHNSNYDASEEVWNLFEVDFVAGDVSEIGELQVKSTKLRKNGTTGRRPAPVSAAASENVNFSIQPVLKRWNIEVREHLLIFKNK